jgi:hypothetical protein
MLHRLRAAFDGEGAFASELSAEQVVERFLAATARLATDDFYCVMDGGVMVTRYEGLDGLRNAWMDFLKAFETLAIEPGDVIEEGPDGASVVEFVRLSGRPKGMDTPIDGDAACVWRFRDGGLAGVEFHMDRTRALPSAGVEP